jgi:hypothetical protein
MPGTAALITATILDRLTCADCIGQRAGISNKYVTVSYLLIIGEAVKVVTVENSHCVVCARPGVTTYSVERPDGPVTHFA